MQVKKADGEVVNVTVQRPARYLPTPVTSSLQQRYSGQRVGVIRLTSFNARALRDVSQVRRKGEGPVVQWASGCCWREG